MVISSPTTPYDAIIVGAGPAGSTCAATLAGSGARVLVLEKSRFPRHKVCGDCLNPACHPLFERLDISSRISGVPHALAKSVTFVSSSKRTTVSLPTPEIVIARSELDVILADRATALSAEFRFESPVERVTPSSIGWSVHAAEKTYTARHLVAADGRNSTVARLLGILPPAKRGRAALQTHLPLREEFSDSIHLQLLPFGYVGIAPVGSGKMNVCLVSRPGDLDTIRAWADETLGSNKDTKWKSMAPLDRAPVAPAPPRFDDLFLLGDAARVVEPFTGEGIYYALRTGELAAEAILKNKRFHYVAAHRDLYRGRLWINRLSRLAVTHPKIGGPLFRLGGTFPSLFRTLTRKVTTL